MATSYPAFLEAVLRTEVGVSQAEFQTRWALKGASLVGAIDASAHALGLSCCGHADVVSARRVHVGAVYFSLRLYKL